MIINFHSRLFYSSNLLGKKAVLLILQGNKNYHHHHFENRLEKFVQKKPPKNWKYQIGSPTGSVNHLKTVMELSDGWLNGRKEEPKAAACGTGVLTSLSSFPTFSMFLPQFPTIFVSFFLSAKPMHTQDLLGGFPGGTSGKEPVYQCRRPKTHKFNPWVGKIPWRRAWQPTPVFLLNPKDRGVWRATVHRVAKSWT